MGRSGDRPNRRGEYEMEIATIQIGLEESVSLTPWRNTENSEGPSIVRGRSAWSYGCQTRFHRTPPILILSVTGNGNYCQPVAGRLCAQSAGDLVTVHHSAYRCRVTPHRDGSLKLLERSGAIIDRCTSKPDSVQQH